MRMKQRRMTEVMTGFETVAAMVKAMDESLGITVPVALHLDHGTYEGCYKCVKAGFTSIMFDGSHYPFEENLAKSLPVSWVLTMDVTDTSSKHINAEISDSLALRWISALAHTNNSVFLTTDRTNLTLD